MHKFIFSLVFIISASLAQAQSLMPYQSAFKGGLQNWARSFTHFNLSDFKQTSPSAKFANTDIVRAKNLRQFHPVYQAALSISPNGKSVLDIYSYLLLEKKNGRFVSSGSDVEQSILLGNTSTKQWQQIAYYGYSQRVQEVYWVNNNVFILAAARLNKANKNLPVVIIGNIRQQSLQVFESADVSCYQKKAGYTSPKITALHIQHTDR